MTQPRTAIEREWQVELTDLFSDFRTVTLDEAKPIARASIAAVESAEMQDRVEALPGRRGKFTRNSSLTPLLQRAIVERGRRRGMALRTFHILRGENLGNLVVFVEGREGHVAGEALSQDYAPELVRNSEIIPPLPELPPTEEPDTPGNERGPDIAASAMNIATFSMYFGDDN